VIYGDTGVIADMLPSAGELVEEGGLPGIRVARKGHCYFICHYK
jgi:hypothetical protein